MFLIAIINGSLSFCMVHGTINNMDMYTVGESLELFLLYSYYFLALQSTEIGPSTQYTCNVYVCFKSSLVLKRGRAEEGEKKKSKGDVFSSPISVKNP